MIFYRNRRKQVHFLHFLESMMTIIYYYTSIYEFSCDGGEAAGVTKLSARGIIIRGLFREDEDEDGDGGVVPFILLCWGCAQYGRLGWHPPNPTTMLFATAGKISAQGCEHFRSAASVRFSVQSKILSVHTYLLRFLWSLVSFFCSCVVEITAI